MKVEKLFQKSIDKWGIESQLLMLSEELNELAVATLHLLRKNRNKTEKENKENWARFSEEIADVEFMMEEMKWYYKNAELVQYVRKRKEKYLERLLKE